MVRHRHDFLEKSHSIRHRSRQLHKGCQWCGYQCLESLAGEDDGILRYRQYFWSMPKTAQDRDLLWIFAGGVDRNLSALQEESSPKHEEHTSSSSSGDKKEVTSASAEEYSLPSRPKVEMTSPSSDDAGPSQPVADQTNSLAQNIEKQVDGEVTSPSSDIQPLVPQSDDAQEPPQKKNASTLSAGGKVHTNLKCQCKASSLMKTSAYAERQLNSSLV